MRVTAAFSRLLDLPGVWVRKVRFEPDRVIVWVALRRKRLCCPKCSYSTMARENEQDHDSVWRAVDLGVRRLEIRARLRRLRCVHGAHVEGVPFARDGARFKRDFEDVVVRHEAPIDRVGCKGPTAGLSQQFGEAGGSLTLETQGTGGSSPDKAGTGQHRQMAGVRRARQRGVTQVNQRSTPRNPRTGSKPGGSGPGCSARPPSTMRWSSPKAAQLGRLGGREEGLRRTRGDAAGVQLGVDPVKRSTGPGSRSRLASWPWQLPPREIVRRCFASTSARPD
jgi:hypothetical protein